MIFYHIAHLLLYNIMIIHPFPYLFGPDPEPHFFADPDPQIYTDLDLDMAKTCGSETLFFYYHDNPTVTSENASTIYFIYVHMPASFTFLARQRSPHR